MKRATDPKETLLIPWYGLPAGRLVALLAALIISRRTTGRVPPPQCQRALQPSMPPLVPNQSMHRRIRSARRIIPWFRRSLRWRNGVALPGASSLMASTNRRRQKSKIDAFHHAEIQISQHAGRARGIRDNACLVGRPGIGCGDRKARGRRPHDFWRERGLMHPRRLPALTACSSRD